VLCALYYFRNRVRMGAVARSAAADLISSSIPFNLPFCYEAVGFVEQFVNHELFGV
jgi:hypothetical protein